MPGHGRRQDCRADGVRLQHRRHAPGRAAGAGDGPGRVRHPRRPRLPADRRPARHLGRARGHRQAGARRPARAEEVAPGRRGAEQRDSGGGPAACHAHQPGAAERERPDPRRGPGYRGRRPEVGGRRGRRAAGRRHRQPRRCGHPGGCARGADRYSRVHYGPPVVMSRPRPAVPGVRPNAAPPGSARPSVPAPAAGPVAGAAQTLERGTQYLLGLQDVRGWWQGELETNVTMDAEDLLLREFLGIGDAETKKAAGRWIRSQQRADGTWANFYGGPGDISTTVEAYVALRLAGDLPDAPHMRRAADWIRGQGGVEASRVFTRIWLALSGQWSWDELPVIPPELIYLPSWFPLNIYDWGCWARQTIVALAVVQSFRPSRPLPFGIDELKTGITPAQAPPDPWARVFNGLDKALHLYRPVKSVRSAAQRRCAEWIIARQELERES